MNEKQILCRNLAISKVRSKLKNSEFVQNNQIIVAVAQMIADEAIRELISNINSEKTPEDIKAEINEL